MMFIGIAGHRSLLPHSARLIGAALLREALVEYHDHVTSVTALADGDPLPRWPSPESHAEYDDLIGHAITVHPLDFTASTSEAHMAASELMILMVSELLAVWHQQSARARPDRRAPPVST
jgi:hypothetical protein